jgi:hypothetical protein
MDRHSCCPVTELRPLHPAKLLRVGCLWLACLGVPFHASADIGRTTALMSITGDLTICGESSDLLNSGDSPVAVSGGLGPVTTNCSDGPTNTASMHAQSRNHPDSPPDIAVVASSTGVGASAVARASFHDIAVLSPPLGLTVLDVNFSITSQYLLTLDLPDDSSGAAVVSLQIPLYAFVDKQLTTAGSSSGTLDTGEIAIANCDHCAIDILGSVTVRGSNGGGGTAKDPFTINLPEGWTYTLASEQQAQVSTVPEPSSFALVGSVLAAAGMVRLLLRRGRSCACGASALAGRSYPSVLAHRFR